LPAGSAATEAVPKRARRARSEDPEDGEGTDRRRAPEGCPSWVVRGREPDR
jgi:hypothetical protein